MAESIESAAMDIDFTIKETKKDGLYDLFVRVSKDWDQNIRTTLENLAPRLADKIRENFDAKGARGDHEPWVITQNPNPLIDLGNLYNSINARVESRGENWAIVIGTDIFYAATLNFGDTVDTDVVYDEDRTVGGSLWLHTGYFDEKRIPAREFMFLVTDDEIMAKDQIFASTEIIKQALEVKGP